MEKRIKDEQRDISYGELAALSDEFETQLDEHDVIFDDEEDRDEAFFDFVQQYIDGDDDPQINWENAKVRPVRDSKRRVKDSIDINDFDTFSVMTVDIEGECERYFRPNEVNTFETFTVLCKDLAETINGYYKIVEGGYNYGKYTPFEIQFYTLSERELESFDDAGDFVGSMTFLFIAGYYDIKADVVEKAISEHY